MKYAGSSLVLGVCAGGLVGVASADEPVVASEAGRGRVIQAAHMYYNMATGERVVTLNHGGEGGQVKDRHDADTVGASGTSGPIWSVLSGAPCPNDNGTTSSVFYVADDNSPGGTSLSTGVETLDYGDIALDSVVDMVHINWITGHPDTDTNSDGIGDGVVGLGGRWTYWDAENGRAINSSTRLPLISFLFADLPGNIFGPGSLTGYSADIDLGGDFSSSMTFEIGDSDGDLQGAAFGNNNVDSNSDGIGDGPIATLDRDLDGLPDSDLDGDGLFDWGWSVRFFQPGTADLDGDGVIDGDIADSEEPIGLSFGLPAGVWVDQGDGTWNWEMGPVTPDDYGYGAEDRLALFVDGEYTSSVSFGGPLCGPEGFTPMGQLEAQLIGPGGGVPCPWDVNGDGQLNFFDISQIIIFFQNQDPRADLNHDGQWNFFDISIFLNGFLEGCP